MAQVDGIRSRRMAEVTRCRPMMIWKETRRLPAAACHPASEHPTTCRRGNKTKPFDILQLEHG